MYISYGFGVDNLFFSTIFVLKESYFWANILKKPLNFCRPTTQYTNINIWICCLKIYLIFQQLQIKKEQKYFLFPQLLSSFTVFTFFLVAVPLRPQLPALMFVWMNVCALYNMSPSFIFIFFSHLQNMNWIISKKAGYALKNNIE